jgi:hypothetical protein
MKHRTAWFYDGFAAGRSLAELGSCYAKVLELNETAPLFSAP